TWRVAPVAAAGREAAAHRYVALPPAKQASSPPSAWSRRAARDASHACAANAMTGPPDHLCDLDCNSGVDYRLVAYPRSTPIGSCDFNIEISSSRPYAELVIDAYSMR